VTEGLEGRCGTCARFVRVTETVDLNGEVQRRGECLLGVWPPPLFEANTCSQYVRKGTFAAAGPPRAQSARQGGGARGAPRGRESPSEAERPWTAARASTDDPSPRPFASVSFALPEELLDMDADEFRRVLRDVLQDELGVRPVDLGSRWSGGEVILKPGKEGTASKSIPIEALFHKIVMIRDRLRVLEQRINAHAQLSDEEKVQMQQYVTQCYGSLTTFNVLFADRRDAFMGQKGDKDD
jgi:hypothetical protein